MFSNKNDSLFKNYQSEEEYERARSLEIGSGLGRFFSKYILYTFIYIGTYLVLAMGLIHVLGLGTIMSASISLIVSFFVFKVTYVKEYKFKSMLIIYFILFLEAVAFGGIKI